MVERVRLANRSLAGEQCAATSECCVAAVASGGVPPGSWLLLDKRIGLNFGTQVDRLVFGLCIGRHKGKLEIGQNSWLGSGRSIAKERIL